MATFRDYKEARGCGDSLSGVALLDEMTVYVCSGHSYAIGGCPVSPDCIREETIRMLYVIESKGIASIDPNCAFLDELFDSAV